MTSQTWVQLIVGLVASLGIVGTLWQRQHSERVDRVLRLDQEARVEWWRRFQWAAEQSTLDNFEARIQGLMIIEALADSPLLTSSERGIVEAVAGLEVDSGGE